MSKINCVECNKLCDEDQTLFNKCPMCNREEELLDWLNKNKKEFKIDINEKKETKIIEDEERKKIDLISISKSNLTQDLENYGKNEKNNINKEKTRNRNQPYAFLNGGNFGEELTLEMFPNTIGSGSKGGMAFDNKTYDENKNIKKAKEVKFISLNGTKQCLRCKEKTPIFQKKCIKCNNEKFKIMRDSRASISSKSHIDYKSIINEYIIFVQDYNDITKLISLKAYKFLSNNEYFNDYIQNQYDSGDNVGGSCNLIPYSYDWYLSGPITILDVDIDITNTKPIINYKLYNPLSDKYDKCLISDFNKILTINEKEKIDKQIINDNIYYNYEFISKNLKLRYKSIGKSRGTTTRR